MERDLDEVTVSQSKMLQNLGKLAPDTAHFSIEQSFRKTNDKVKTWLNDKQNMNVIYIDYKEAVTNSEIVIEQLNEFFESKLNTQHMQQIIDKNMYRTQK